MKLKWISLLLWPFLSTNCYHPTFAVESDETQVSNLTLIEIITDKPNLCPTASLDRYVVKAGEPFSVHTVTLGLLANDQDEDDGVLTVVATSLVSQQGGVVHVNADGTFSYDQPMKFWGGDEFVYTLSDGQGCKVEGTVLLSVRPQRISLADIAAGYGGVAFDGESEFDQSGESVSKAGDVNGDGFADFLIGAPLGGIKSGAGRSYIVFGGAQLESTLLTSVANGQGGFALDGEAEQEHLGDSVSSVGDVNGDGYADFIVSAPDKLIMRYDNNYTGRSYVVLGGPKLMSVSLTNIVNEQGGFALDSESVSEEPFSLSTDELGDINGDGFTDFIIGNGEITSNGKKNAGRSYVKFGNQYYRTQPLTEVTEGWGGFSLDGEAEEDFSGHSVSGAGDINGDGLSDFMIGAPGAGKAYVVFGSPQLSSSSLTNISKGQGGISISGEKDIFPWLGWPVSEAGDVNGDGFADFVIGAPFTSVAKDIAGRSYVVFGSPQLESFSLADISKEGRGVTLDGEVEGDFSGYFISGAGDINGDGFSDMLIAAPCWYNASCEGAKIYVVFGRSDFKSLSLMAIAKGQGGFVLDSQVLSGANISVSGAGDINGDGFADLLIGAPQPTLDFVHIGRTYLIYGGDFTGSVSFRPTPNNDIFTGTSAAESMIGGVGNDELLGNGGADVLYGGQGDDILSITDTTFFRIDGGTGHDTLRLDGTDMHLDLSLIPELALQNIETIDLNGNGNRITLELRDLVASSDTSNTLIIKGQTANQISADLSGASFIYSGTIENGKYVEYLSSNNALRLWIESAIQRNILIEKP